MSALAPSNAVRAELTKPQWDAALEAARILASTDPSDADDRKAFREAKARLTALLPADADASAVISQAVRWDMLNSMAGAFAGLPARALAR